MVVVDEVAMALREIEPEFLQPTRSAEAAFHLEDRIRGVRKLIAEHGDRWISVSEATRYVTASSEDDVMYWAQVGRLRGRTLPSGQLELSLDSVLADRENYEVMTAIDNGEPITPEEAMYLLRPLEYPPPPGYPERVRRPDPAR